MTQPAQRTKKHLASRYIKRQAWVLFILIISTWIIDKIWLDSGLVVTKSLAIGSLLSYISQAIFARFVFKHAGYRARQHIVGQLYRGQIVKWLITVFGFAFIFIYVEPLSPLAVFVGFIIMKVSHSFMLWRMS